MKLVMMPTLLLVASFGLLCTGCDPAGSPQRTDTSAQLPASPTASTAAGMKRADAPMQAVLDKHASLNPKPIENLSPGEARQQPTIADAVKALLQERGMDTAPEPVGKVENKMIAGAGGQIPARVYWP